MADMALPGSIEPARRRGPNLDRGFHPLAIVAFMGTIAAVLLFVAYTSAFIKSQARAGWVQVKTRYDDDDISGADRSWRTSGPRKVDVSVVCKGRRPSCRRHASSLQHTTRNRRGNSSWGFQSNRGALQRRFEARRPAWTDYSSQHGTKTSVWN
jgi:hypothetical protein